MDDLYGIAASGMAAQRAQMDLIAQNLANAGVVRADGSVYRPRSAVLESASEFAPALLSAQPQGEFAFAGDDLTFGPASGSQNALVSDWQGDVSFEPDDVSQESSGGVAVARIVEDERAQRYRYDPGSPFAPKAGARKGYVTMPDVDPIEQMVAMVASGRAYDADVSMLQAAKQMDLEAADIDRA